MGDSNPRLMVVFTVSEHPSILPASIVIYQLPFSMSTSYPENQQLFI